MSISSGAGATLNLVEGNYIGTAPGGGVLFGQGDPGIIGDGVLIENAPDNIIGGSSAAAQNVISANQGVGVMITGASATGNSVAEQYDRPDLGWGYGPGELGRGRRHLLGQQRGRPGERDLRQPPGRPDLRARGDREPGDRAT